MRTTLMVGQDKRGYFEIGENMGYGLQPGDEIIFKTQPTMVWRVIHKRFVENESGLQPDLVLEVVDVGEERRKQAMDALFEHAM